MTSATNRLSHKKDDTINSIISINEMVLKPYFNLSRVDFAKDVDDPPFKDDIKQNTGSKTKPVDLKRLGDILIKKGRRLLKQNQTASSGLISYPDKIKLAKMRKSVAKSFIKESE
jgi:hypothetical protein